MISCAYLIVMKTAAGTIPETVFISAETLQPLLVGEAALIDGAAFGPLEHELAEPRAGVDRERPAG